jgi:hypothetical protein
VFSEIFEPKWRSLGQVLRREANDLNIGDSCAGAQDFDIPYCRFSCWWNYENSARFTFFLEDVLSQNKV